jgi:hypothetical protein
MLTVLDWETTKIIDFRDGEVVVVGLEGVADFGLLLFSVAP